MCVEWNGVGIGVGAVRCGWRRALGEGRVEILGARWRWCAR